EVGDQPVLARAVVVRRDAQPGGDAPEVLAELEMIERDLGVVRSAPGDHRHAARRLLDADRDDPAMLVAIERGALAGGAARDERARPGARALRPRRSPARGPPSARRRSG